MKKIKSIGIILLGISALFLSSCSNSPENLKVIPEETNAVSVIDFYSIIKKGKLDEISELKFFKTFKKEIRNENKKVSKNIDNVIEDPTISGIDFKTDVFAYYVYEANDEKFISFSAEIENEEKFAEFIEDILDDFDIDFDIEKEEDYSYILMENDIPAAIGWDEDKAVLLITEDYYPGLSSYYNIRGNLEDGIETLFGLKEKDQITANEEFNKFHSNKKDISVWFSSNLFEDSRDLEKLESEIKVDMTDNYISAYLNFGDDHISLKTEFTPNSDIQEMMKDNDVWDNSMNNELLNYFPKEQYATVSMSLNPMTFYNIFEESDAFEEIQYEFEREAQFDLQDVVESFKGNAVYSLFGVDKFKSTYMDWGYGFNENKAQLLEERYIISMAGYLSSKDRALLNQGETIQTESNEGRYCINIKNILEYGGTVKSAIKNDSKINWYYGGWEYGRYIETTNEELLPLMGLAIDINGNEVVKDIIDQIPEGKINKRSDYYEFTIDNRYPAYFSFNESVCFITNDKKSIKAFKDGGYSSGNLGSLDISSDITNSNLYSFLNLNYDEYPKDIKKEIKNNQNDNEEKMYKIWNDFAKSIELKQVDNNSIEIIFNTKENESNSLNTVISTIDDNYKYFMSL